MRARHPFVVVIAAGLMLSLSACAPERSLEGESSTPPSSSAPSESATPEAPEEVDDGATPITQTCEELVSAQTIYDYNPHRPVVDEGKQRMVTVGLDAAVRLARQETAEEGRGGPS